MREPGFEPGTHAWEACMLTTTLFTLGDVSASPKTVIMRSALSLDT